ncbi:hypothetical protein [Nesterenkonia sedimenti]|uniref:hypothetical protein n=1 Tax=Nesterenkonia sedimenti TaxID=1463632 RepID=UPI001B3B2D14|nr:hypothetical protein [Nesterenkonia sedimenti]
MSHAQKLLIAARITAVLSVAAVVVLFATGGQLVQNYSGIDIHGAAAIGLHITTGLLALTLVLRAVLTRTGIWAAAAAMVLFGISFVQAELGDYSTLANHVLGSVITTVLCTWLTAWSFARRNSPAIDS